MPELFADMLNQDNSIFNAAIRDNQMLKRAIDMLSNQKLIENDPKILEQIESSSKELTSL